VSTVGGIVVSTPPDAHETSRLSGTVSTGARWRVSGFSCEGGVQTALPKSDCYPNLGMLALTYSECWSRTFGGYRVARKASFEAKA
jgi:hypothetical protein